MLSTDALAAIGAFASGVGAMAGAFFTLKRVRKDERENCAEKLRLFKEGIETGEHIEGHDEHTDVRPGS